mmetsp:Transcript_12956/g.22862  ORF Transcript_12956/g.22862 Transcript_12956/m.22862 type:complete len:258 (-) Transcript_12956:2310-3083(-)
MDPSPAGLLLLLPGTLVHAGEGATLALLPPTFNPSPMFLKQPSSPRPEGTKNILRSHLHLQWTDLPQPEAPRGARCNHRPQPPGQLGLEGEDHLVGQQQLKLARMVGNQQGMAGVSVQQFKAHGLKEAQHVVRRLQGCPVPVDPANPVLSVRVLLRPGVGASEHEHPAWRQCGAGLLQHALGVGHAVEQVCHHHRIKRGGVGSGQCARVARDEGGARGVQPLIQGGRQPHRHIPLHLAVILEMLLVLELGGHFDHTL